MNCIKKLSIIVVLFLIVGTFISLKQDFYFPMWATFSKYNQPIKVLDTNSSLGRYSKQSKDLRLKDLALVHGHLCDGLVIAFVELRAALNLLSPNGIVDRTDLRVITKNGPCWVDASAFITGARINFGTLSIDSNLINSLIVQKISTGETYQVSLKDGVFPEKLAKLETKIKSERKNGKKVSDEDIASLEKQADEFSKKLLNTNPNELLNIKKLENFKYVQNIQTGTRGDIINK